MKTINEIIAHYSEQNTPVIEGISGLFTFLFSETGKNQELNRTGKSSNVEI
jgi:hypothetical protein